MFPLSPGPYYYADYYQSFLNDSFTQGSHHESSLPDLMNESQKENNPSDAVDVPRATEMGAIPEMDIDDEDADVDSFGYESESMEDPVEQEWLETQFAKRVKKHAPYFSDQTMIEINDPQVFESPIPDVGMEKILITSSFQHSCIGTTGLATCLAVCSRGRKADGEVLLAVAHLSCLDSPSDVVKYIFKQFLDAGCWQPSIESYILGGILSSRFYSIEEEPHEDIYDMLCDSPTTREQDRNPYNIKALKLFCLSSQECNEGKSLTVAISANELRYSKSCTFEGQKNVGIETSAVI
ncbi:Conserved hypothetical protein [Candidatus Protochlamydia naegleriophila]|uniref:Uncharacterized protein n=1 Tax=Candidatus Protochlamydia naegleriophila TaxID=389348 RepID=A0A0U5J9L5_9BACT|nr:hypothetical protein [Candidatus Protochlamydia naegleriophila]CUI16126.1 Conserved hypothetical protein [Candidatus Protochlamydia naegleriophila]